MRKRDSRPAEQVFTVTGLPTSLQDDQSERMRRYLMSMGIRTVSFLLAVVALAVLHWTVIGWLLVVAAVVLPYIAVVVANATRFLGGTPVGPVTPSPTPDPTPNGSTTPQISPRPDEEQPR